MNQIDFRTWFYQKNVLIYEQFKELNFQRKENPAGKKFLSCILELLLITLNICYISLIH